MKKLLIKRPLYIDKIKPFMKKDIIKVLIGQRRVGKSHILLQIMDELQSGFWVHHEEMLYINKELYDFDCVKNYQDLLDFVQKYPQKKYIFIDEIQDIVEFEKALRDLQARWGYDIYISGSNANLLSGELATVLTGRYIEFEIYPLIYSEFLTFHQQEKGKESFWDYLKFGGMPYLTNLSLHEEIVSDYIKSIYNTIVLKDIVKRYAIRNIDFLERLIFFLAENIGNLTTANTISKYLKSQKIDITVNTVLDYLGYVHAVFLVNQVKRMDVVGKKIFEVSEKYYFSDIGMRNVLLGGYRSMDIGKILENIVFLHFKAHGYQVFVGKDQNKEIDFVVQKWSDKKYIQVAYLIVDEDTKNREFGNLLTISDHYEKLVLSLDDFALWDIEGVKHYNIIDYLVREP